MTEISSDQLPDADVLRMTADIVSAYVRKNPLPTNDLPEVINAVHGSLVGLRDHPGTATEPPKPAVPPRKSVTADYIICLEDGKKLKMLKRHLRTAYNMTPEEYRAKWGLQPDYPMVAPNYAKRRSDFAKKIGLGQKEKRRKAKR
ncbi:MAG TPA: MucR family transcriptional regulator [Kiloniellales bacterium]|nr:MucR family transcriptional regulator [Kiloniellales bacterium]